jgi:hypothetical protein
MDAALLVMRPSPFQVDAKSSRSCPTTGGGWVVCEERTEDEVVDEEEEEEEEEDDVLERIDAPPVCSTSCTSIPCCWLENWLELWVEPTSSVYSR